MNTNDLITILSQAPQSKKPMSFGIALLLLLGGVTIFTFFVLGLRPDLALVTSDVSALHKTILLMATALSAGIFLNTISKPVRHSQSLMFCPWLVLGLFLSSIGIEIATTPIHQIASYFFMVNFPECLFFVTLYGVLGLVLLTWLMKFYAPENIQLSGIAIGLAASATGALGYSIHCPIDSPIFITIAYGMPVLAMGFIGKFIVSRYVRW
jgi:hypothetical protein